MSNFPTIGKIRQESFQTLGNRVISTAGFLILSGLVLSGCIAPDEHKAAESANVAAVLSAEGSYEQSIQLLSSGKQNEAEALIDHELETCRIDHRLLFAQGVMLRSRWGKRETLQSFDQLFHGVAWSVEAQAAALSLLLDCGVDTDKNLAELIRLSDQYPDDIYLLWLSAIQCREQAKGELGKLRYQKLLSHFDVGPVMAHHTYANILTEYTGDYEEALKHRYIALSMAPCGWTYQGLASTLRNLGKYDLSCEAWAKAVELEPEDSVYWQQWGSTLYEMEQYEESLEKYERALALNSADKDAAYWAGLCQRRLKNYNGMVALFQHAAALGHDCGMYELARAYQRGQGVEKNLEQAYFWYAKAATNDLACAQRSLGYCYAEGLGVKQDWSKAIQCFQKAAEQNDIESLFHLGVCYQNGTGVKEDQKLAAEYYKKVLEISPEHQIAGMLLAGRIKITGFSETGQPTIEQGSGEPLIPGFSGLVGDLRNKQSSKIAELEQKALAGDVAAQISMARWCAARDWEQAVMWYQKAADQGSAEGLSRLAFCYSKARGVEQNIEKAFDLFSQAESAEPDNENILNAFCWFLSDSTNATFFSSRQFVSLAERLVAKGDNYESFLLLSHAYAADGRFLDAFRAAERHVELWKKHYPGKPVPSGVLRRQEEYKEKAGIER